MTVSKKENAVGMFGFSEKFFSIEMRVVYLHSSSLSVLLNLLSFTIMLLGSELCESENLHLVD